MLSILIPTTTKRVDYFFPNIIKYIDGQIKKIGREKDVQLLWIGDNYSMSIGEKRNALLGMAKGKYSVFIDDDDSVADTYIKDVLEAISKTSADVILYENVYTINGERKTISKYFLEHDSAYEKVLPSGVVSWEGAVPHTVPWKTNIIKGLKFEEISFEEDLRWAKQARKLASTFYRIEKPLYFYRFFDKTSETREGQP